MKSPQTILTDYLAMRRSLGFKLQKHEPVLREFLRFFATQKASYLTAELALQWARKPQHTDPAWWTSRLSILRGFATYLKNFLKNHFLRKYCIFQYLVSGKYHIYSRYRIFWL